MRWFVAAISVPTVSTNETANTPRTVRTYLRDTEAQRLRSILGVQGLATSWSLGKVLVELSPTVHADWSRSHPNLPKASVPCQEKI